MRRLLVFCALLALAVPASASAFPNGSGDGTLVIRNGSSDDTTTAVVRLIAFHGAAFGQVDSGKIVIDDLTPLDAYKPTVTGYDSSHLVPTDSSKRVYLGSDMRFRVDGGVYTVSVYGAGVDLNAVGQGKAWLQGSATSPAGDGRYSIDGADFKSLPAVGGWYPIVGS
jgi:hypothetical protein